MELSPINLVIHAENSVFRVHIAETQGELNACLAFRHRYFRPVNDKMGTPYIDEFDLYYSHLMVTDMQYGRVVGTCRLLRYDAFETPRFYYSETLFDLRNIKAQQLKLVEMGRVCTSEAYRNKNIISMIWRGVYAYVDYFGLDYITGFVWIPVDQSQDMSSKACAYAKYRKQIADQTYFVAPKDSCIDRGFVTEYPIDDMATLKKELPKLFLTYLTFNAKICSISAYDSVFHYNCFYCLCDIRARTRDRKQARFGAKSALADS